MCLDHVFSLKGDLDALYLISAKKNMQIYVLKSSELYNSSQNSWEFESLFLEPYIGYFRSSFSRLIPSMS